MDPITYYPGCALKNRASGFETTARQVLLKLGAELRELPDWNCCGVVSSLCQDDLIHQVAPVRNLIRASHLGTSRLITLCAMCYNTLHSANELIRNNPEKRDVLNQFMYEESDYHGEVCVHHLLSYLRDVVGWDRVRAQVTQPFSGLTIVPYYGCMLLRPAEAALEPNRRFTLFGRLLEALGARVPYFDAADHCCGSYQIAGNPAAARDAVAHIVDEARKVGADAIALACPLCDFNLTTMQGVLLSQGRIQVELPTFYFTQLMALAMDVEADWEDMGLSAAASRLLTEVRFSKIA